MTDPLAPSTTATASRPSGTGLAGGQPWAGAACGSRGQADAGQTPGEAAQRHQTPDGVGTSIGHGAGLQVDTLHVDTLAMIMPPRRSGSPAPVDPDSGRLPASHANPLLAIIACVPAGVLGESAGTPQRAEAVLHTLVGEAADAMPGVNHHPAHRINRQPRQAVCPLPDRRIHLDGLGDVAK